MNWRGISGWVGATALLAGSAFAQQAGQPSPLHMRPLQKLPPVVIRSEHIARRVFDPALGGLNVGVFLVRMPGGEFYLREGAVSGEIGREFFRFAIHVKLAQLNAWRKEMRERKASGKTPVHVTAPKPLKEFFGDDTLSRGDVIVALEGFRVFRGSATYPWKESDFVTIERWQKENGARRGLREMERESRRRRE